MHILGQSIVQLSLLLKRRYTDQIILNLFHSLNMVCLSQPNDHTVDGTVCSLHGTVCCKGRANTTLNMRVHVFAV